MRTSSLIVVLCGPSCHDGYPSTRRIFRAIQGALDERSALVIAGDGAGGTHVKLFTSMAEDHGVEKVISLFDTRASTVANVEQVVQHLRDMEEKRLAQDVPISRMGMKTGKKINRRLEEIFLVSDSWHLPRAQIILQELLSQDSVLQESRIRITPMPARTPKAASPEEMELEKKKLVEFQLSLKKYDLSRAAMMSAQAAMANS